MRKKALFFLLLAGFFCGRLAAQETVTIPAGGQDHFQQTLNEARQLVSEGHLLDAQSRYQELLPKGPDHKKHPKTSRELEALNMKILFSKLITAGSVLYEVQPGDSLSKIAKKYNTTIELIKKCNGLSSDTIYSGKKIKIVTAEFSIFVDRSRNRLYLKEDGKVIKTYSVATGAGELTPLGTFTIEVKLVDPVWYDNGRAVPPEDPENILGTRWMGFSLKGYGIHGTTLPESIGTSASAGCVRMLNQEVEELYVIVPPKTSVTIVE